MVFFLSFFFTFLYIPPYSVHYFALSYTGLSATWKVRTVSKSHFHILILLSINQILTYLEVRIVKQCILRRQTP